MKVAPHYKMKQAFSSIVYTYGACPHYVAIPLIVTEKMSQPMNSVMHSVAYKTWKYTLLVYFCRIFSTKCIFTHTSQTIVTAALHFITHKGSYNDLKMHADNDWERNTSLEITASTIGRSSNQLCQSISFDWPIRFEYFRIYECKIVNLNFYFNIYSWKKYHLTSYIIM